MCYQINNTIMQTTTKETDFLPIFTAFKINSYTVFEVRYYRLSNNPNQHFSTCATEFNRPKTGFNQCGQAQKTLLKGYPAAMNFYKKWDKLHLQPLTKEQYLELVDDLKSLSDKYTAISYSHSPSFEELKDLSKSK